MFKRKWPFSAAQDTVASAALSDATMDSDEPTAIMSPVTVTMTTVTVPTVPTDPKPQEGVKRKDPLDKIVDIVVGNGSGKKYFEHHRRILSKESKHFRDSFRKDWEAREFSFPNEEPEIYARVAHWMYFKEFVYDEEKSSNGESEGDSTQISEDIEDEVKPDAPSHDGVKLQNDEFHATAIPKSTIEVVDLEDGSDDSDDDEPAQALAGSQSQPESPTPLDTLTLSKIWALARRLGIPKLCDEIIDLLGKRLGYDMKTPGHALIYAFQRCRPDSPLRRLLVDFTARSAPITDLLGDAAFDATDFAPELWCALVGGLVTVRGDQYLRQAEWTQNFELTVSEYHINKPRVPFRPKVPAHVKVTSRDA